MTEPNKPWTDPELYASLSKPYASQTDAEAALSHFVKTVRKLREECGVADLVLVAAVSFEPSEDSDQTALITALALGSSQVNATLAAEGFRQFAAPAIKQAERCRRIAMGDET